MTDIQRLNSGTVGRRSRRSSDEIVKLQAVCCVRVGEPLTASSPLLTGGDITL